LAGGTYSVVITTVLMVHPPESPGIIAPL